MSTTRAEHRLTRACVHQVYGPSAEAATKLLEPVLQSLQELDTTLASVMDDVEGVRGEMHDVRTKQEALGLYASGNAAATANSIEITVRGCAYVPAHSRLIYLALATSS